MNTQTAFLPLRTASALLVIGVTALLGLGGCKEKPAAPPPQQEVLLNVSTVDLQSKPVESVRFYINNKKFGITDQEGKFAGKYPAKNGDTLTFNVEAPDGYSVPPNPDQSRWQVKIQYPADGRPLQIDFRAELQRPERDFLLMVRAEPEGTPIKLNDVAVGKTGPGGDALVKISGVPGAQFVAAAGTAVYKGTFSEDDEVYLLSALRTGPVADGPAGAAPPPVEVAAAPATEPPLPTPAPEPAVAEAAPTPPPAQAQPDPWAVAAAPAPAPRAARANPGTVELAPEPAFEPPPEREPPPPVVAAAPPREEAPGIDDLLPDEPAAAPPPPPVAEAPRVATPKAPRESTELGGLMNDGGDTVDPKAARGGVALSAGGPSAAAMSKEEIDGKLEEIQGRLAQSKVLTRADMDFLGQIDRTHPGYYEAHRLMADYHHKNKDYRRQAEELEVATTSGRYKRDPTILLSLAKAYGLASNVRKALSTMQRVDENIRNLPADLKDDAYKFYAEMYEFEFQRQYSEDPKKANVSLIDKALRQWERYATIARGTDPGGVASAEAKMKKLEEMKNGLEL
ncbi:hypothetical protein L6V77_00525 [Myxococcota bacterium]|nr:hypothetical protein [Myxococcota bacterium]